MSDARLSFSRVIDTLAHSYGEPDTPAITDPFQMIVLENIAYLASDARRAEAFDELRKTVGLRPAAIRKASHKTLLSVTGKGIVPENGVEKLRRIAEITEEFGDDLSSALKKPAAAAKKDLRKFPSIGEPAAEKILLFNHKLPVLAMDSNGLRVLVRLGFAPERRATQLPTKVCNKPWRLNYRRIAASWSVLTSSCDSTGRSYASGANRCAHGVRCGRNARFSPRRHFRPELLRCSTPMSCGTTLNRINDGDLKKAAISLCASRKDMLRRLDGLLLPNRSLAFFVFILLISAGPLYAQNQPAAGESWKFAVSGDSRNCGDIVMPAIAQQVRNDGAAFYWHLGDFRKMSDIDEDYRQIYPGATIDDYLANAWPDFIQHQMKPFGDLQVFLGIGNHELMTPKTRRQYVAQFAGWLDQPVVRQQRLADNPGDHVVKTYYHWIERGVDFIAMDNASHDMFGADQLTWFQNVLAKDAKDPAIRTVVLGMHASLPDGLSAGHSMNDSAHEQRSGRIVYSQLVDFRRATKKHVYVLASHSHFVLNNIYATACHPKDEVLDGWIMGSAGAVWYLLPQEHPSSTIAMTKVYGYLLATVAPDGAITFDFRQVKAPDVPASVVKKFTEKQVDWCFANNIANPPYQPNGPSCATGASPNQ
jgi:endonuclease III